MRRPILWVIQEPPKKCVSVLELMGLETWGCSWAELLVERFPIQSPLIAIGQESQVGFPAHSGGRLIRG